MIPDLAGEGGAAVGGAFLLPEVYELVDKTVVALTRGPAFIQPVFGIRFHADSCPAHPGFFHDVVHIPLPTNKFMRLRATLHISNTLYAKS
jgi:hypothetical protein